MSGSMALGSMGAGGPAGYRSACIVLDAFETLAGVGRTRLTRVYAVRPRRAECGEVRDVCHLEQTAAATAITL
jgi:hypothetical protein